MFKSNSTRFPLRLVLVAPFVVQILIAVGLVAYLSYHTGQKAVKQLADKLMTEQGNLINQHLDSYLGRGQKINNTNQQRVKKIN